MLTLVFNSYFTCSLFIRHIYCDMIDMQHPESDYCDPDAAFCVHSTAFCLTADAPSSSPILRSSSSHFLKNDLHEKLIYAICKVIQHVLCLVTSHFNGKYTIEDVSTCVL